MIVVQIKSMQNACKGRNVITALWCSGKGHFEMNHCFEKMALLCAFELAVLFCLKKTTRFISNESFTAVFCKDKCDALGSTGI